MIAYQFLTRNLTVKLCSSLLLVARGCYRYVVARIIETHKGISLLGAEVGHGLWIEGVV